MNLSALLIIFALVLPTTLMLRHSDHQWRESGIILFGFIVAIVPVFFIERFGYVPKFLYFLSWLFVFICVQASFGRVNGTHIPLLIVPAMVLFFLGPNRWVLAIAMSIISLSLFLLIEYLVPWQVTWNFGFLEAIRNEFPTQVSFGLHDLAFVTVVTATVVVNFAGAYLTLSALQQSEQQLASEHARSEMLLSSMLPVSVAKQLKQNPTETIAEKYDDVSILFSDLVGFTAYSSKRPADEVVSTLNALFLAFDNLVEEQGLEKIKTVGDAYMVAGGLEVKTENHSEKMADLALRMIDVAEQYFSTNSIDMTLRIGIHRGPAVAGVVGNKRPFYDVWGDTVNVASRMEATARPGAIQVTRELMEVLQTQYCFRREHDVRIKGKGEMERYQLTGRGD